MGFAVILRDVTSNRLEEHKFRTAVEAAPCGMIMVNSEGRLVLVNRETERLFGYARNELLERPLDMLIPEQYRFRHAQHCASFFRELSVRPMAGGTCCSGLRKDGTVIPLMIGLHPVESPEERLVLAAIVDMTERKKAEAEMIRRMAELQAALHELDMFAYTIAHDLRAPLRAIQGFLQILLEDAPEKFDDTMRDYASRIIKAVVRMDRMILDLLAYSRSGREDLTLTPIDVGAAIREVVESFRNEAERTQAKIRIQAEDFRVKAHPVALRHVITNLLSNALKFVRPGVRPEVEIQTERLGPWVRVSVSDNGIGIAEEHRDRLFRVFCRLVSPETYAGTGVGLAIVRKLVERMGGRVDFKSQVGVGSRFWFELQAADPQPNHE